MLLFSDGWSLHSHCNCVIIEKDCVSCYRLASYFSLKFCEIMFYVIYTLSFDNFLLKIFLSLDASAAHCREKS